jgi:DegV family protein with EDD domain
MIGLVTDSNGSLPAHILERLPGPVEVRVVPLVVTVDGIEYLDGVDLDPDTFYRLLAATPAPTIGTSQPSPGRLLAAYRDLAARGVSEIVSVHLGSELSGTLNAARLDAGRASVPVHIVDTHTASFGVAFAVWAAAEAIAVGSPAEQVVEAAEGVAARLGNVFVVRALDLAAAGGRILVQPTADHSGTDQLIPVLVLRDGKAEVLDRVATVDDAADAMAGHIRAAGTGLRVALGIADAGAAPLWQALEFRLVGQPEVDEVIRYRIGPSVGVHTGPGTAAALYLARR